MSFVDSSDDKWWDKWGILEKCQCEYLKMKYFSIKEVVVKKLWIIFRIKPLKKISE